MQRPCDTAANPASTSRYALRNARTETADGEGRLPLRYHPCRQVRNQVKATQGDSTRRQQITCGQECTMEITLHG